MKTSELIVAIENTYSKHFPNSKIFVKFSTNLYSSISVRCFLAGDKNENSGGYWDNDILNVIFMISSENFKEFPKGVTLDSELGIIGIENNGKSYNTKPDNQYMAFGRKELSFRRVQGNTEKIIKVLNTFFEKMKTSLQDDLKQDRIHKDHIDLVKNKLG
jgi:hypothetical protein